MRGKALVLVCVDARPKGTDIVVHCGVAIKLREFVAGAKQYGTNCNERSALEKFGSYEFCKPVRNCVGNTLTGTFCYIDLKWGGGSWYIMLQAPYHIAGSIKSHTGDIKSHMEDGMDFRNPLQNPNYYKFSTTEQSMWMKWRLVEHEQRRGTPRGHVSTPRERTESLHSEPKLDKNKPIWGPLRQCN